MIHHGKYVPITELAEQLSLSVKLIRNAVRSGDIMPPKHTIETGQDSHFYWTLDEAKIIKKGLPKVLKTLKIENGATTQKKLREANGLFSVQSTADAAGVSTIALYHHIKHERIKKPTTKSGNILCYTQEEHDEVVKFLKARKKDWLKRRKK